MQQICLVTPYIFLCLILGLLASVAVLKRFPEIKLVAVISTPSIRLPWIPLEIKVDLASHVDALCEAEDLNEFRTAAKQVLLVSGSEWFRYGDRFKKFVCWCNLVISIQAEKKARDEAVKFAAKISASEFKHCPPHLRETMISRMCRRSNPQFTIPVQHEPRIKIMRTRSLGMDADYVTEKVRRHTNEPEARAASIAEREAEIVWQQTGSFQAFWNTLQRAYESALREICCSENIG